MRKSNKSLIIAAGILSLLPIVIGLALWNRLPAQVPGHWNLSGEVDIWMNKALMVFGMPVIMFALYWIGLLFTRLDPRNREANAKPMYTFFLVFPLLSLVLSCMTYATALGMDIGAGNVISLVMGLTFLLLGNYLPKCQLNSTLGIKVPWALENTENWNMTHRFGGKMWVIGGALLTLSALLPGDASSIAFIAVLIPLAIAPILYSYLYCRRQKREGRWKIDGILLPPGQKLASRIILIGALILVALTLFTGDFTVTIGENSVIVDATYWSDIEISYENISFIEYRTERVDGDRTHGYGSPRLLMGQFRNDEFGYYTRYTYTQCDESIVLKVGESAYVLSGKNSEDTRVIYEALLPYISE